MWIVSDTGVQIAHLGPQPLNPSPFRILNRAGEFEIVGRSWLAVGGVRLTDIIQLSVQL